MKRGTLSRGTEAAIRLIAAVLAVLGIWLYMRYARKREPSEGGVTAETVAVMEWE